MLRGGKRGYRQVRRCLNTMSHPENLAGAIGAVDSVLRRSLMGVYLALNTVAKVRYGMNFAELLFKDPEKAVRLVREYTVGDEESLTFIMRAALSALTDDRNVLNEIMKAMEDEDYLRVRELLLKVASLPIYRVSSHNIQG